MSDELQAAGVKEIVFYENKGIEYTYSDPFDCTIISSIANTGAVLTIEACHLPKHSREFVKSNNYPVKFNDIFEFVYKNFDTTTIAAINSLLNSRFGYIAKVTYSNDQIFVFQDPVFCSPVNKGFNSNVEVITMNYQVESNKNILVFNSTPVYSVTFDSNITSFDYTFLTFDQTI